MYPLLVISLKRTPERLRAFYEINQQTLHDWNVEVIDGIDGVEQGKILNQSRWISDKVKKTWSQGAIGSALSHIKAWRQCIERNEAVLVVEDDAVLADNLIHKLKELNAINIKEENSNMVLLGWNLDSLLHAEISPGLEVISLFEPAYPEINQIRKIINTSTTRRLCHLKRCFGLPAYLINPKAAKKLIAACKPLQAEKNGMTRGIPEHYLTTLDGMLTNRYEEIEAKIVTPPLAVALNNQATSLTRHKTPQNFQG